jgi:hypothetical protein
MWAAAAFVGGFFLSLPFVMILGLSQAGKGQSDAAILLILAGATAIGILSGLFVLPQTRGMLTKRRGKEEP